MVQVSYWLGRNDTRVVPYGLRPYRVRKPLNVTVKNVML